MTLSINKHDCDCDFCIVNVRSNRNSLTAAYIFSESSNRLENSLSQIKLKKNSHKVSDDTDNDWSSAAAEVIKTSATAIAEKSQSNVLVNIETSELTEIITIETIEELQSDNSIDEFTAANMNIMKVDAVTEASAIATAKANADAEVVREENVKNEKNKTSVELFVKSVVAQVTSFTFIAINVNDINDAVDTSMTSEVASCSAISSHIAWLAWNYKDLFKRAESELL